ncbi:MAG: acetate--CoA ligase family protein [Actinomycetota bacterium]|nr:acetate--CoA ligase family protein [Actinomycetota bacterium]
MRGQTLSEAASKKVLADFGVPLLDETLVADAEGAVAAARQLGFPVVAKLCGDGIAHKTERGLVRLRLADADAVRTAAGELLDAARPQDGDVGVLVAPMVNGARELIAGTLRDEHFGPTVMFGVGGVAAEAIADVVFRPAPLSEADAGSMIDQLRSRALLEAFRGEAPIDRDRLVATLVGLGRLAAERDDIASVDVNPLLVTAEGRPVAVDALVELRRSDAPASEKRGLALDPTDDRFQALFEPRGVLIAGASTHPGKFGFVSLHNLLSAGYRGRVFATNLQGERVLGIDTVPDIAELPDGEIDLVFVCTPASANEQLLRACAAKGVRAAFLTSAGYGEAGLDGMRAERHLVAVAEELGLLLVGPNGQGVVSTPAKLCAQMVAPYPPVGHIGVVSQSGNFVSSFMNLARQTGVGVSRAVSAGNAAAVGVADFLAFYAHDPATKVGLAYIEGIIDGAALMCRLGAVTERMPLVIIKGGSTEGGARAAASHTGAMAADDAVFDGACRQHGICRAATVEEAFEAAATFATQPAPQGPNVAVLTTAGGWGVVTADAVTNHPDLALLELPDDLLRAIDMLLPARWSRNNPIDCAGGERRDTIPEVMELVAHHPDVHAVVYLGLGIQSNQARMMREGGFYPDHGLQRIVDYHERQDRRFAEAAHELSVATGKPILTATELAVADPGNTGPATVRATGRLCYPSGERAVRALGHLVRDSRRRSFGGSAGGAGPRES